MENKFHGHGAELLICSPRPWGGPGCLGGPCPSLALGFFRRLRRGCGDRALCAGPGRHGGPDVTNICCHPTVAQRSRSLSLPNSPKAGPRTAFAQRPLLLAGTKQLLSAGRSGALGFAFQSCVRWGVTLAQPEVALGCPSPPTSRSLGARSPALHRGGGQRSRRWDSNGTTDGSQGLLVLGRRARRKGLPPQPLRREFPGGAVSRS